MKKSSLLAILILLPVVFACAQIKSVITPREKEIKSDTKEFNLPKDAEFAEEDTQIKKEDSVIFSIDNETLYLGDKSYSMEELKELVSSVMRDKTPEKRIIYINGDGQTRYGRIVEFLDRVRKADIDKVGFIVKTKDASERLLGVLMVKLPAEPKDNNIISKPNPLTLVVSRTKNGQTTLNGEEMNLKGIQEKLKQVFKERENNGVFREGTNEVEKTVFIKSSKGVSYKDVIETIDAIKGAGSNPIGLQLDDLSNE